MTQDISETPFFYTEKNVEILFLKDYANICRDEHKDSAEKIIKAKICILKKIQHATVLFKKLNECISRRIKFLREGQELSIYVSNNPRSIYIPFGWYHTATLYEVTRRIKPKCIFAEKNSPEMEFEQNKKDIKYFCKILSKINGGVMQTMDELLFYESFLKQGIVIHNPIRSDLPEVYQNNRRKVVVNFCRISPQKNLPLLMKSFVDFCVKYPEYTLEIYGNIITDEENAYLEDLKEWVLEKKCEHVIMLLPPRADIHNLVNDCAMFVSSSDYEGISNSMLEAMAIGLPVVCTDCLGGGAREMINDGENGLLVPVGDSNALTAAM